MLPMLCYTIALFTHLTAGNSTEVSSRIKHFKYMYIYLCIYILRLVRHGSQFHVELITRLQALFL